MTAHRTAKMMNEKRTIQTRAQNKRCTTHHVISEIKYIFSIYRVIERGYGAQQETQTLHFNLTEGNV